jgi:hypothetical protein
MKLKALNAVTGEWVTTNIYTDEERTEDFKDTIWKHKVCGYKVRVWNWRVKYDYCFCTYYVDFESEKESYCMMMTDFKLVYERVGKAKYDRNTLKKLEFEVDESK